MLIYHMIFIIFFIFVYIANLCFLIHYRKHISINNIGFLFLIYWLINIPVGLLLFHDVINWNFNALSYMLICVDFFALSTSYINTTSIKIDSIKKEFLFNTIKFCLLKGKLKKDLLKEEFKKTLSEAGSTELNYKDNELNIYFIAGVNGAGKTTLIAKMAYQFKQEGKKVLIAAGDTFRAAAEEQLNIWSTRAGADIVRRDKADPASVVYEAIQKAKNENYDVILVDTAGRLQNKFNLMEELKKIKTVIDKQAPNSLRESILVIDANTGQNGLQQAKVFSESVNLTCVALTKLDGSAKGAIIIAIAKEMKLPVKLVGVGEQMTDLKAFNPEDFINALFE